MKVQEIFLKNGVIIMYDRDVLLIIQLANFYISKYDQYDLDEEGVMIYEKVMQLFDMITEKARKEDTISK